MALRKEGRPLGVYPLAIILSILITFSLDLVCRCWEKIDVVSLMGFKGLRRYHATLSLETEPLTVADEDLQVSGEPNHLGPKAVFTLYQLALASTSKILFTNKDFDFGAIPVTHRS